MKKILIQFVFIYSCLGSAVFADVPAAQMHEVNHLFAFIKNSACIINRNGTDYPAEKSLQHIKKKYDYFRDEIKSTEDFIALAASKSTMSGEHYRVTCPGEKTVNTQTWLLSELKKYREEQ